MENGSLSDVSNYLKTKFNTGAPPITNSASTNNILISAEETGTALNQIGRDKAPGCDQLNDRWLRLCIGNDTLMNKLANSFTEWLNHGYIPKHLKVARVVTISKDDTPFPQFGKVRPIAILPTTFKLLETILNNRLKQELT